MATSPFGNPGMSQFGSEQSYIGGDSPLTDAFTGVKNVLTAKGIQASGLKDFLNSFGGKPAIPPSSSGVGVNPYQNTGMPGSQPYAMQPFDMGTASMGASGMETGAAETMLHPEVSNTLLTALF